MSMSKGGAFSGRSAGLDFPTGLALLVSLVAYPGLRSLELDFYFIGTAWDWWLFMGVMSLGHWICFAVVAWALHKSGEDWHSIGVEERVEIEVAGDILKSYVGKYELTPEFVITVTLEDGALFAQATGQPKFPVFAESETKFFLRVVEAQISFTRDESGTVSGAVLHQGGTDQAARKVN